MEIGVDSFAAQFDDTNSNGLNNEDAMALLLDRM
jgi:hypothetical protein